VKLQRAGARALHDSFEHLCPKGENLRSCPILYPGDYNSSVLVGDDVCLETSQVK
jgi:hypothetical protein